MVILSSLKCLKIMCSRKEKKLDKVLVDEKQFPLIMNAMIFQRCKCEENSVTLKN